MSVTLVTFEDIYTAVCEAIKVPVNDGVTLGRTKRDINMIYLQEIIPFKPRAWWWLEKKQEVQTYAKITTGTVSISNDSTTITFSSAPSSSVTGYYFKVQGHEEVIKVSAHTGGQTTATLEVAWRNGAISAKSFTLWKDYASLDSDMKEVVQVTHDRIPDPIEAVSNVKFTEYRARCPELNGYPTIYNTGDFDSNGNRIIRWYPASYTDRVTLHVEGRQEATALTNNSDEPLMPVEDRISIFYGACSLGWARQTNTAETTRNWNLFQLKLNQMAAKSQDAPNVTEMQVDAHYLIDKRYRRAVRNRGVRYWSRD